MCLRSLSARSRRLRARPPTFGLDAARIPSRQSRLDSRTCFESKEVDSHEYITRIIEIVEMEKGRVKRSEAKEDRGSIYIRDRCVHRGFCTRTRASEGISIALERRKEARALLRARASARESRATSAARFINQIWSRSAARRACAFKTASEDPASLAETDAAWEI